MNYKNCIAFFLTLKSSELCIKKKKNSFSKNNLVKNHLGKVAHAYKPSQHSKG